MAERPVPVAATISSARALALLADEAPLGSARVLRLAVGPGRAVIAFDEPRDEPDGTRSGAAMIAAPDEARGAALLDAISAWLGMTAIETRQGRIGLRPVAIRWVELGAGSAPDGKTWHVVKLLLDDELELFLRLSPARDSAELLEKDSRLRTRLALRLAGILRDGVPPDPEPVIASRTAYRFRGHPTTLDLATWAGRSPALRRYRDDVTRDMGAREATRAAERLLQKKLDAAGNELCSRYGSAIDEAIRAWRPLLGSDGKSEAHALILRLADALAFLPHISFHLWDGVLAGHCDDDLAARAVALAPERLDALATRLKELVAAWWARSLCDSGAVEKKLEEIVATRSRPI